MLLTICPKLPIKDNDVTKEYYINKLGFQLVSEYPDYLIIKKDDVEIHFFMFKGLNIAKNYSEVYIRTKNIESIYQKFLDKEVIHQNGQLETKQWG